MPRKTAHVDGVYQRPDRPGYWITWNDVHGRRRRRKTDALTLVQAREILAGERLRVEHARVLGYNPPGEDTFADVAARYLQYQKARLAPASYIRAKGEIENHLKPFFAGKLGAISKAQIQAYLTKRLGEAKVETARKEFITLKHLLRLATDEWEIIPRSPAAAIHVPGQPKAMRARYAQPAEFMALMENSPEWLRPIIALAALSGMRRGEILGLRWRDLDLDRGRVFLPITKNGESRIVYLGQAAVGVLRRATPTMIEKPAAPVFPVRNAQYVRVAFERARKRAGIPDFRFHDLRHTAASWMRMRGADTDTVRQMLGHRDDRMARRYQHLSPGFMGQTAATLDAVLGPAVCAVLGPVAGTADGGETAPPRHQGVTGDLALVAGGS